MKRFISSISLLAALVATPAFAADYGFRTVLGQDELHAGVFGRTVTARVIDGSIEPLVRSVHTDRNTKEFFAVSYMANMWVLERQHCANALQTLGLESTSCFHFSQPN